MDNIYGPGLIDDFLSPEALQALALPSDLSVQSIEELFAGSKPSPSQLLSSKLGEGAGTKRPHSPRRLYGSSLPVRQRKAQKLPGCSVFDSAAPEEPRVSRAKFKEDRREEVALIRKRGACLRCRYLKLPVRKAPVRSRISANI